MTRFVCPKCGKNLQLITYYSSSDIEDVDPETGEADYYDVGDRDVSDQVVSCTECIWQADSSWINERREWEEEEDINNPANLEFVEESEEHNVMACRDPNCPFCRTVPISRTNSNPEELDNNLRGSPGGAPGESNYIGSDSDSSLALDSVGRDVRSEEDGTTLVVWVDIPSFDGDGNGTWTRVTAFEGPTALQQANDYCRDKWGISAGYARLIQIGEYQKEVPSNDQTTPDVGGRSEEKIRETIGRSGLLNEWPMDNYRKFQELFLDNSLAQKSFWSDFIRAPGSIVAQRFGLGGYDLLSDWEQGGVPNNRRNTDEGQASQAEELQDGDSIPPRT